MHEMGKKSIDDQSHMLIKDAPDKGARCPQSRLWFRYTLYAASLYLGFTEVRGSEYIGLLADRFISG